MAIIIGQTKSMIELAVTYKPDTQKILMAIANEDKNSTALASRFAALSTVIDTQVTTAYKNRFNKALLEETGILGIIGLLPAQQRNYCIFCRVFATQYATFAVFGLQD